jgi:hypothetical protein
VIYAGFVAQPMGWLPAQKGRQKGPLEVPNKASYSTTKQHPTNPSSYYIPLQQVIQKRLFQNFHFILGLCLSCNNKSFARFGLDVWIKPLKKLILGFGFMWFLATYTWI